MTSPELVRFTPAELRAYYRSFVVENDAQHLRRTGQRKRPGSAVDFDDGTRGRLAWNERRGSWLIEDLRPQSRKVLHRLERRAAR